MDRDLLLHLPVVVAVAKRGGFAAAAAALGITPSAASHAVRLVEERLGQPLFARTTRSVAPTEAGARLVAAIEPAFADIADAVERERAAAGAVSGLLRINTPRLALPLALTAIVARMAQDHPGVTVELYADEGLADIVADGFDAGVRLGEMIAGDMVAIRLTPPFQAILAAAPAYLARRGAPAAIADLTRHNCIGFRQKTGGGLYRWDLTTDGADITVATAGSVIVTDALQARDLALAGVGIAYIFAPLVADALADGRLVAVLPEAAVEEPGLFLYFPRRAAQAPKLRAFIDAARAELRAATAARA